MSFFDNIPGATLENGQHEIKSAYDLDFARALEMDKDEKLKAKQRKSAKAGQKRKRDPSPRQHKKLRETDDDLKIGKHVFKTVVRSSPHKKNDKGTRMHPMSRSHTASEAYNHDNKKTSLLAA